MLTQKKRSLMIEDSQIKTLIKIRDERKLRQVDIYQKAGHLIGRIVKSLKTLKKDEASNLIESLSSTNHHEIKTPKVEIPPQIIKSEPIKQEPKEVKKIEEITTKKLTFQEILKKRREEGNKNA